MKATYIGRFILYILVCLLLAGCGLKDARPGVVRATDAAIDAKALEAAKIFTRNGQVSADEVLAVSAVMTGAKDAFMLWNSTKELAIYAAPIVKDGVATWQVTFLDTARVAIVSSERIIQELGGDARSIKTLGDMRQFLSGAGFKEVSTATAALAAVSSSARLALAFMRSCGSYTITPVVLPAYFFSPDTNPFATDATNQQ